MNTRKSTSIQYNKKHKLILIEQLVESCQLKTGLERSYMNQVTLYVPGICCLNMNHSIEQEIKSLKGIISYKGTLPKGKIVIEYTNSQVSSREISHIIEDRGFSIVKKIQREKTVDIYN